MGLQRRENDEAGRRKALCFDPKRPKAARVMSPLFTAFVWASSAFEDHGPLLFLSMLDTSRRQGFCRHFIFLVGGVM